MDAVKFIREQSRMCTTIKECENCPIYNTDICNIPAKDRSQESAKRIVALVEKWSKENPPETRQSLFIKQYPKVAIYNGVIGIRPCQIEEGYTSQYCLCDLSRCVQCRKEYWLQEEK